LVSSGGLNDGLGHQLDGGAGDSTPGGDYTTTFTVNPLAAGTRIVSIDDFARGPGQNGGLGQEVILPATPTSGPPTATSGIPINISDGSGVDSFDLTFEFDPTLLDVTGVTLPAGWTSNPAVVQTLSSGREKWTLGAFRGTGVALSSGITALATIQARVLQNAPYGESHLIDLEVQEVTDVNTVPIPTIADDAVHSVNYVGDANMSIFPVTYSTGDLAAMQNWIGQAGNPANYPSFNAYPNTDAIIVADTNNSSTLTTADINQVQQESTGQPGSPFIPAVNSGMMMMLQSQSSSSSLGASDGLDDAKKEKTTTIARGLFSNAPIGVLS